MRKKLLSILLSVCIVLTLLPTAAFATNTTENFGDFSVTHDGTAPDYTDGALTFNTAGEYTVSMADNKTSTTNRIVVSASDVTLNLNGVTIEAPAGSSEAPNGTNALTVENGTTLNVIADSSLTGGIGFSDPTTGGTGGAGISGDVAITGAATLTATGGIGGSAALGVCGTGGAGISGNATITGTATLTATGGMGGAAAGGISGTGGAGISGNVAATDSASLVAIGGQCGGNAAYGGSGISGNLTVTGSATVSATGGDASAYASPGKALTGTLTATGFIIKGGYTTDLMEVITSSDSHLNQFRYLSVTAPNVAEIGSTGYSTLQTAVDAVTEGQTIKLLDNVTVTDSSSITISGANSFTLDLNGKTLDGGSGSASLIKHNGSGTLTIQDSGTGGKITSSRAADNIAGTVELSGGNGNLTLLSGTIENTSANGAGIYNNGTGTVSIQDGAVTANDCGVNNMHGNVSVSGGEVSANSALAAAISSSAGKVTLSGGRIYNSIYVGVFLSNSSLVVSGGVPVIQGGQVAMNAVPTVDSDTIENVIASTNYDGRDPAQSYDAAQITSYKYLAFVVKVTPTAAAYAAASPAAAPGTDYVLDTDNKVLTIKTDKGAAFWSASGAAYLAYTVKLAANIDVSDFLWTPVGSGEDSGTPFTGNFDGQGHTVTGLTVEETGSTYVGFFAYISQAAIRNVGLIASTVSGTNADTFVGGIVGMATRSSSIENCWNNGNVSATGSEYPKAGGIVGVSDGIYVSNCYFVGTVSAVGGTYHSAGGISGPAYNGINITNSFSLADCVTTANAGLNVFNGVSLTETAMKAAAGTSGALIDLLNSWVSDTASTAYYTWQADSATTSVNGGYPVFGPAWVPQARWGVAGIANAAPNTWSYGSLTAAMNYANTASALQGETAYIQLLENVDTDATLMFDGGRTTVLDLNGKTIDANDGAFSVLTVNGSLMLCDSSTTTVANQGKITGGNPAEYGGGVYIESTGRFTMTGGNITGNTSGTSGGGVYGNRSDGGRVMTMTGGSITGNHTQSNGGGVFIQTGGFTVGGTAKITGNTSGAASEAIANNVCLYGSVSPSSQQILTISTATPLATGASIGVNTNIAPASGSPINITVENAENYSGYFTSDNSSYAVQNSGTGNAQVVQLAVPAPTVTAVSPTSGSAGTSVTITGTNLSGATAVKFGSTSATSFTVTSSTSITATAPAGTGTVDITVTTANGTSATGTASKFTYALPTAAEYAVNAASPTDYLIEGNTLTIYTAKGAAFWSASGMDYLGYTVLLAANIDVSGFLWTPVGNSDGPFTGSFDGQGHSISGLTITAANIDYAGLFGGAQSAAIQNLCVSGTIDVTESNDLYIGGIVGWLYDSSTVRNCCSHVDISGTASYVNAGGIVGWLDSGTIENCFNTGNVSGTGTAAMIAGGIYGEISSYVVNIGMVKNSYNIGSVTGGTGSTVGALGGSMGNNIVLENCYYLSGTASAAFGSGSNASNNANSSSFTVGTVGTLLSDLNKWVAKADSSDYRTWTADDSEGHVNGGYPVFGAAWGENNPIFNNCFGMVTPAKDETPNAGIEDYGYTFSGWYTAPNGEGTQLGNSDPGTIGTHYYAKWTYNGHTVRTTALDLRDISESKLYGSVKNGDVYTNAAEGWTWYAAQTVVGSSTYAANTLVLSGLTLHTAASTALLVPAGTTIVAAAEATENRVWSGYTSSINEDAEAYGIYGAGALNIRGGGSLNVLAGSANSVVENSSSIGIFSEGDLTISDAVTVTAKGSLAIGDTSSSAGIRSDTAITISGGTVTATGGSADTSLGIYCGYDEGGEIEGTIRITGGTVTATGGTVPSGGTSVGLGSMITITISGGTVAAKSGSAGNSAAVFALDALTVGSTEKVATIANATDGTDPITTSSGNIASKTLLMSGTNPVEITFTTYDITANAATNGSYTVKVNGSAAASAQLNDTVTVTPAASSGYELDTITVCKTGDTATTVPVTNGSFTMPAYGVTVSVTFKTVAGSPTGGTPTDGGTTAPTGAPVIVDGKTENIGTESKSGDTTTVTVDQSKLGTSLDGAASGSSVIVQVSENGSATASLMVQNIEDMAAKGMTLTVQTGGVAYNLNTSAIDTAALAAAFPGADMSKVPFDVTITNSSVSVEGETLVLSPVTFTVTATYGGKTVEVDTFSAYIDRVIKVTAAQAAKITTAVVVNADGSVRHVPTNVIEKDGKYYAVVSSRTNSTYALIQNEVTFADAAGKWYEATVNEMGSRKIIAGRSASVFDGDASITKAEFSAILVRALGLPADGTSTFSDVPADAWYTGAVATAAQYGIVSGKGGNRFEPDTAITRQEAMLMLQRAAALTEFTGAVGNLDSFADADSVGAWARDAAKWSVGSGLIQGADGKLNPTASITRAESATIILRLLQKAELVDVRSEA